MNALTILHYGPAVLGVISLGFLTVGLAVLVCAIIGFKKPGAPTKGLGL